MAKRVGMRNFKTVLSVFLCIMILEITGISNPFFACITAIFVMQTDMHTSLEKGVFRLIGTVFGSIMGSISAIVFYKFLPMDILLVRAIVIPLGIMLIIYTLTSLKLDDAILISCVVFLAIIMIWDSNKTPLIRYALERINSTTVGTLVALLVNRFICPYDPNCNNKTEDADNK